MLTLTLTLFLSLTLTTSLSLSLRSSWVIDCFLCLSHYTVCLKPMLSDMSDNVASKVFQSTDFLQLFLKPGLLKFLRKRTTTPCGRRPRHRMWPAIYSSDPDWGGVSILTWKPRFTRTECHNEEDEGGRAEKGVGRER